MWEILTENLIRIQHRTNGVDTRITAQVTEQVAVLNLVELQMCRANATHLGQCTLGLMQG